MIERLRVRMRMRFAQLCLVVFNDVFIGRRFREWKLYGFAEDTGAVAQLEERLICIQQVIGSNPFGSTMIRAHSSVG